MIFPVCRSHSSPKCSTCCCRVRLWNSLQTQIVAAAALLLVTVTFLLVLWNADFSDASSLAELPSDADAEARPRRITDAPNHRLEKRETHRTTLRSTPAPPKRSAQFGSATVHSGPEAWLVIALHSRRPQGCEPGGGLLSPCQRMWQDVDEREDRGGGSISVSGRRSSAGASEEQSQTLELLRALRPLLHRSSQPLVDVVFVSPLPWTACEQQPSDQQDDAHRRRDGEERTVERWLSECQPREDLLPLSPTTILSSSRDSMRERLGIHTCSTPTSNRWRLAERDGILLHLAAHDIVMLMQQQRWRHSELRRAAANNNAAADANSQAKNATRFLHHTIDPHRVGVLMIRWSPEEKDHVASFVHDVSRAIFSQRLLSTHNSSATTAARIAAEGRTVFVRSVSVGETLTGANSTLRHRHPPPKTAQWNDKPSVGSAGAVSQDSSVCQVLRRIATYAIDPDFVLRSSAPISEEALATTRVVVPNWLATADWSSAVTLLGHIVAPSAGAAAAVDDDEDSSVGGVRRGAGEASLEGKGISSGGGDGLHVATRLTRFCNNHQHQESGNRSEHQQRCVRVGDAWAALSLVTAELERDDSHGRSVWSSAARGGCCVLEKEPRGSNNDTARSGYDGSRSTRAQASSISPWTELVPFDRLLRVGHDIGGASASYAVASLVFDQAVSRQAEEPPRIATPQWLLRVVSAEQAYWLAQNSPIVNLSQPVVGTNQSPVQSPTFADTAQRRADSRRASSPPCARPDVPHDAVLSMIGTYSPYRVRHLVDSFLRYANRDAELVLFRDGPVDEEWQEFLQSLHPPDGGERRSAVLYRGSKKVGIVTDANGQRSSDSSQNTTERKQSHETQSGPLCSGAEGPRRTPAFLRIVDYTSWKRELRLRSCSYAELRAEVMARWLREVRRSEPPLLRFVLLLDARDAVFLGDPFGGLPATPLPAADEAGAIGRGDEGDSKPTQTNKLEEFLAFPVERFSLNERGGWHHGGVALWNAAWVVDAFDDRTWRLVTSRRLATVAAAGAEEEDALLLPLPVLNSGMMFGTANAAGYLLSLLVEVPARRGVCVADQGTLNGLMFGQNNLTNIFPPHLIRLYLGDPYSGRYTHALRSLSEATLSTTAMGNGASRMLLNCRGEPYLVVHQADWTPPLWDVLRPESG